MGLVGYGYSLHCLIGLASSSGTGEQHHDLPKEDGLWPAYSHNRKLPVSWEGHKAKFPGFVCRRNVLVQFKANLRPHCSILLDIILETIGVSGTFGRRCCKKHYILKFEGIDDVCLRMKGERTMTREFVIPRLWVHKGMAIWTLSIFHFS